MNLIENRGIIGFNQRKVQMNQHDGISVSRSCFSQKGWSIADLRLSEFKTEYRIQAWRPWWLIPADSINIWYISACACMMWRTDAFVGLIRPSTFLIRWSFWGILINQNIKTTWRPWGILKENLVREYIFPVCWPISKTCFSPVHSGVCNVCCSDTWNH